MTNREKLKRAVIEAIYSEISIADEQCPVCGYYCIGKGGRGCIDKKSAFELELNKMNNCKITIGRVMHALGYYIKAEEYQDNIWLFEHETGKFEWKLTKENGEECTDDDQDIETIEKLLNLLTK